MTPTPLAHLAALERTYDGPIPDSERMVAAFGSARVVERLYATGRREFYRRMALGQIAIIRARRADGSLAAYMLGDLRLYHDGYRRALAELRQIEREG